MGSTNTLMSKTMTNNNITTDKSATLNIARVIMDPIEDEKKNQLPVVNHNNLNLQQLPLVKHDAIDGPITIEEDDKESIKKRLRTKNNNNENVTKPKKSKKTDKDDDSNKCTVCTESYNLQKRKQVTCCKCNYHACRECYQRYFLQSVGDPHCMSCRVVWGYSVLFQNFTKIFVKETWNNHRARVLMDHEKSLMSTTMDYVQAQRAYEKASLERSALLNQANLAYDTWQLNPSKANNDKRIAMEKQYRDATTALHPLQDAAPLERVRHIYRPVDRSIMDPLANVHGTRTAENKKAAKPKKKFTWPCPQEDCKGFLDEKNTCGICDTRICKKCHCKLLPGQKQPKMDKVDGDEVEVKESDFKTAKEAKAIADAEANNVGDVLKIVNANEEEVEEEEEDDEKEEKKSNVQVPKHVCKKSDVETMRELKKSTRQCPRCPALIYRISGCAQVWCTQCFTAFDYVTGEIATGRIHNPHYFEYVQKHGKAPPGTENKNGGGAAAGAAAPLAPVDPCGLPNIIALASFCTTNKIVAPLCEIQRQVEHVEWDFMPRLRQTRDTIDVRDCPIVMRIKYMLNRLSEADWARKLSLNDQSRIWAHEALQIYFTWTQSAKERLRMLVHPPKPMTVTEVANCIRELLEFTRLTNHSLHQIALCYNASLHYIVVGNDRRDPFSNLVSEDLRKINHYIYPVNVKRMKGVKKPNLQDIKIFA